MEKLWKTARDLGRLMFSGRNVTSVRNALPNSRPETWTPLAKHLNDEVFAGYRSIEGQILTLGWSLETFGLGPKVATAADGQQFLMAARGVFQSAAALVEWVRSRIAGYPRMLVPHIDSRGPYSDQNSMPGARFPWFGNLQRSGIQLQTVPPDVRVGFGLDTKSEIGAQIQAVASSLQESTEWNDFEHQRFALTASATEALRSARNAFWTATSAQVLDQNVGPKLYRHVQYLHQVLHDIRAELPDDAGSLWDAFERLDARLEQTWRVVAHFALRSEQSVILNFSSLDWTAPGRRLRISVEAGPWGYDLGDIVSIPPAVVPPGLCGLIESKHLSFAGGDECSISMDLNVLEGAWPHLAH